MRIRIGIKTMLIYNTARLDGMVKKSSHTTAPLIIFRFKSRFLSLILQYCIT
jgi:hypothetical protein